MRGGHTVTGSATLSCLKFLTSPKRLRDADECAICPGLPQNSWQSFTLSPSVNGNRELQALKLEVEDAAMGRLPGGSLVEPRRNNLGKGDRNLGSIFVRDLDHRQ
jgi:hypothetical protein